MNEAKLRKIRVDTVADNRNDTVVMIAALYVETGGCYFDLAGVEPWDEARDARGYPGPYPVVAHPPCQRWGKMWAGSPSAIAKTGVRKVKGDDGGCFAAALNSVRLFGGVLEHPWGSHAWPNFGLTRPSRAGGWIQADEYGWTCCVEQGRYGHYARKPTLLYAVRTNLPELDWGEGPPRIPEWAIEKYGLKRARRIGELAFRGGGVDSSPRIGTPEPFRNLLISIARTAGVKQHHTDLGTDVPDSGTELAGPPAKEFCHYCGAGVGKFRRKGEGTCPECDPPAKEQL
jgi:hypothetical protein